MNTNLTTKPHYVILDGLRGVAALMVVAFHLCEAHATGHLDQIINHGYLAVDFFFMLSGFVIGYAYDDRWGKLTLKEFFKRRLIRLQPMVIIGSIIGAIFFYFEKGSLWPMVATVPVWKMLLVMLIGATLIPLPPAMDIRGWNETHPLNGPAWSLFYEYVANFLYALVLRRLSKVALLALCIVSAAAVVQLTTFHNAGDIAGGWTLEPVHIRIGLTRVMYPFCAGLFLCRVAKLARVKNAFLWSSLLVIAVLAFPRLGGAEHVWMNGVYESFSIICIFPFIIYLGAGGSITSSLGNKLAKFFGDISYPIYITHYPLVYTYTAWVYEGKKPLSETWPVTLLTFITAVGIAWLCLKLYDEPVRKWLQKKTVK